MPPPFCPWCYWDALRKMNVAEAPLHDVIYSKASQWGCCSFEDIDSVA